MKLRIVLLIGFLLFSNSVQAVEVSPLNNQEGNNQSIVAISRNSSSEQRISPIHMTWEDFKRNSTEGWVIICDGEIRMSSNELISLDLDRSRFEFPNLFNFTITKWGNNEETTNQRLERNLSILFTEGNFQNLSSFSYLGNSLNLPAEIENLEHLTYLELLGADRLVLPKEIGKLVLLNRLIISNSGIREIPKEIGNLKNLKILELEENNLTEFPKAICNLINLSILDIPGNRFTTLPEEIGNLKYLNVLNLSYNELVDLPEEIWNLVNLSKLNLSHNELTNISPEIENLMYLDDLDLRDNKLTHLPRELGYLEYLKYLAFSHNDLNRIPNSIFELPLLEILVINKEFLQYIQKNRIYSINMWNNEYTIRLMNILEAQPR